VLDHARAQQTVDLGGGVVGGERRMSDGHLSHDPLEHVEAAVAESVVEVAERVPDRERVPGGAGDEDHRAALGQRPPDSARRGEVTDPAGDHHRARAGHPPVALGGVGGIELVAVRDPAQPLVGFDLRDEAEHVVARDAEDVLDAEFGEPVQQVMTDGVGVVCHVQPLSTRSRLLTAIGSFSVIPIFDAPPGEPSSVKKSALIWV